MIVFSRNLKLSLLAAVLLIVLTGCAQGPDYCGFAETVRLENPETYSENDQLPFQFPLENPQAYTRPVMTRFGECGWFNETRRKCHAAEDYAGVPGTPVYAYTDGEISFSGRMGGYGWLIIIDHPQFNLYSLYGHLSPSRWQADPGPVEKGELIGYLGDGDENGGTPDNPLVPHLHFGIRVGQRLDYPGSGEWRWMAGWISLCPQEAGWLQPSVVIAGQQVPEGGFPAPVGNFLAIWWFPLTFGSIYLVGFTAMLIFTTRSNKPQLLASLGVFCLVGGMAFFVKNPQLSLLLFLIALAAISIGGYRLIKNRAAAERNRPDAGSEKGPPPSESS